MGGTAGRNERRSGCLYRPDTEICGCGGADTDHRERVYLKNRELGYQEIVDENGFNFSSGERQRIILARALVRDSDIYIFDEAFSQIDISKTWKILESILEYLKDKTVIVISHRNNFYKLFGRVLKLENGKVYEICEL